MTGMHGTIHFNDLLGLETPPGQVMTSSRSTPAFSSRTASIHYQLLPDQLVKIERGEWPFMGGRLILQETVLNFGKPTAKRLTFEVVGLDAQDVRRQPRLQGARGDRQVRRRPADDLR